MNHFQEPTFILDGDVSIQEVIDAQSLYWVNDNYKDIERSSEGPLFPFNFITALTGRTLHTQDISKFRIGIPTKPTEIFKNLWVLPKRRRGFCLMQDRTSKRFVRISKYAPRR